MLTVDGGSNWSPVGQIDGEIFIINLETQMFYTA